jgi:hypothetical protein
MKPTTNTKIVIEKAKAKDFNPDSAEAVADLPPALKKRVEEEQSRLIAGWIKSKYDKCKLSNAGIRAQWNVNRSMYKGDQYVAIINGRLTKIPAPPTKIRMVINKIRPAIRTQVSRMTSQKPSCSVVPASNDDEDILAAEAGEAVWEHISETEILQRRLIEAAWWASITGVGYLKQEWDPEAYNPDANPDPLTGEPQGAKGDICITSPSPYHVHIPDLLKWDIEDQPYVIHSFTMSLEEAQATWPDYINAEHMPTVVSSNEIDDVQYYDLKGSDNAAKPDSCLVLEAWLKPNACKYFPQGAKVVVVDNIVVSQTEKYPYSHGEFPFSKIDDILTGGYYSASVIEDMIPLQKDYNRSRSQQVEYRNKIVKPGYFVQEGSVDLSKWRGVTGQLIPIKPGFQPPTPINIPPMPAEVGANLEILNKEFEDTSGQHQVSKGTAPSGVTAATAISFLQEQDQSFMAPTYTSLELAIQKTGRQCLMYCAEYWDEPRLIKAVGLDQAMAVRYLKAADIKNGTDLRTEAGSSMPQSKAAHNAWVMDLMSRGLIPPDKGLEMLNMRNMRTYFNLVKLDENHANRENIRLKQIDPMEVQQLAEKTQQIKQDFIMQNGYADENEARQDPVIAQFLDQMDRPMLPVNDWDNDEIHIFIHQKFMKSQAFEVLDPSVQEQFIKHVEAHKAKQQSTQLNQLMMGGTTNQVDPNAGGAMGAAEQLMGALGDPSQGNSQAGGTNPEGNNQFSGIEGMDQNAGVDAGQAG